ncbi:MAG: hypothetical protein EXS32_08565 [Opitutus sp.]|nr:hypothetical protein [Opitutus sp.]
MAEPDLSLLPRARRSRFLPWIVLGLGLTLTVFGWKLARVQVRAQDEARFERLKERLLEAVDQRLRVAEQALFGGRALNGTADILPRGRWTRFVESLARFYDHGVVGLGYVERVPREQVGGP